MNSQATASSRTQVADDTRLVSTQLQHQLMYVNRSNAECLTVVSLALGGSSS